MDPVTLCYRLLHPMEDSRSRDNTHLAQAFNDPSREACILCFHQLLPLHVKENRLVERKHCHLDILLDLRIPYDAVLSPHSWGCVLWPCSCYSCCALSSKLSIPQQVWCG